MSSAPEAPPPSGSKRSRIVVNIDDPRAPQPPPGMQGAPPPQPGMPGPPPHGAPGAYAPVAGRRPGRGKRILAIIGLTLGLLILVVGIGGFIYYQRLKSQPAYALALLIDAAQRNDPLALDAVVDIDKLVESFVPQVTAKASERYGTTLTPELRQRIDTTVPGLVAALKPQVREEIMKNVKEVAARAEGKPFFLIVLAINWITKVTETGDTAQVAISENQRNLELTMQRIEGRWKVVGLKDEALAAKIAEDISKSLPALGGDVLGPIEKEVRDQIRNRTSNSSPNNNRQGGRNNKQNQPNQQNLPDLPRELPREIPRNLPRLPFP